MIIARIETCPLHIPFGPRSKSDASAWRDRDLPAADALLLEVVTDTWGQAFRFRAVVSAKLAIDELIAPSVKGQRWADQNCWKANKEERSPPGSGIR